MIINGELVTVSAAQLRTGDVIISGSGVGAFAARYVLADAADCRTLMGYLQVPVAREAGGRKVGEWNLQADRLSVAVIRPRLIFSDAVDEVARRSGVSTEACTSYVLACLGSRGQTFLWSTVDELATNIALSAAEAALSE